MANALNTNVRGAIVLVRADALDAGNTDPTRRLFQVHSGDAAGYGALPATLSRKIYGYWLDTGGAGVVMGQDLERTVAPEEADRLLAKKGLTRAARVAGRG